MSFLNEFPYSARVPVQAVRGLVGVGALAGGRGEARARRGAAREARAPQRRALALVAGARRRLAGWLAYTRSGLLVPSVQFNLYFFINGLCKNINSILLYKLRLHYNNKLF